MPYKKDRPDFCPPGYEIVKTKRGYYPRRKRGTVKPATLNSSFKRNNKTVSIVSPATKRILRQLEPFTNKLGLGLVHGRITGQFTKQMNRTGSIGFGCLSGWEIYKEYPLDHVLRAHYTLKRGAGDVSVEIPIYHGAVKKNNNIVTHYFFELILLYGDPLKERGLRIESESSPPYLFDKHSKPDKCTLSIALPTGRVDWMLLLKLGCIEGNEMAIHPRHYGMKVVLTAG